MWFKQGDDSQGVGMGHPSRIAVPSILSADVKIEGDIVSEGELHISGSVKGDVVARKLTLAEGASITDVEADIAMISGSVNGRLTATSVLLARTARVVGDITHVSLSIELGALFEGFSRRVESIENLPDDAIRAQPQPPRLTAPRSESLLAKDSKES